MLGRSKRETPLQTLANFAKVLDSVEFVDGTSAMQKKALREGADSLRTTIEELCEDLTPPILVGFYSGAAAQAKMSADSNPLAGAMNRVMGMGQDPEAPLHTLTILVAYLARDLLAGERVQ